MLKLLYQKQWDFLGHCISNYLGYVSVKILSVIAHYDNTLADYNSKFAAL